MTEALCIGEPAIEVRVRRNVRARRMVLRVAHAGRVPTLTVPPGVSLARARAFLREQEGWLRRHLAASSGDSVRDGSVLPFGDAELMVRAASGRRMLCADGILHVPGSPADLGPRVAAYLREEARRACAAAVALHVAELGLRPGRISLRDPRSRWGSCTARGDLMFSWRLVLAPPAVLDYVVAHEVAHLKEMNHSPRFWAIVRHLCPTFESARDWLRRHGAALHGWDFRAG